MTTFRHVFTFTSGHWEEDLDRAVREQQLKDDPYGDKGVKIPPGLALATWLRAQLQAYGWAVEYTWTTPTGHAMDARRKSQRYDIEVALNTVKTTATTTPATTETTTPATTNTAAPAHPDPEAEEAPREWTISATPRAGLMARLRHKGPADPSEFALLGTELYGILGAAEAITDLTRLSDR